MKAITFIAVMSLVVVFASAGFAEKGPDYDQAVKYYDSGNYQESVRIFQDYVKKRPEASAYYRIGYGLYKLGKHREAEGYFQQAYLIDPAFSPESAGAPQKYPVKGMRKTPRKAPKHVQSQKKASLSGNSATEEKQPQAKPEAVLGTSTSKNVPPGRGQVTSLAPTKEAARTSQPTTAQTTVPSQKKASPDGGKEKQSQAKPEATVGASISKSAPGKEPLPAAQPAASQPTGPQVTTKPAMNLPSFAPSQPLMPHATLGIVTAILAGFGMLILLPVIALYVYFSLCLFLIAKKLGVPDPWIAWIPLASLWTLVSSAGKPWWWILLLFVPIVQFFIGIYLWVLITENLGRNKWLGLLMVLPLINLVFLGVLAFSKSERTEITMETATPA